jgi:ligand-binding sensor domain-containing protein
MMPSKNITVEDGLPSNTIRAIYKDSRGLLWIGTEGGLCSFDGINYKVFNETNGLKHNSIWSIAEDEKSNLWLSLYGKGLAKYDGKKFTYYDTNDGLIHNAIRKLYYSRNNHCLVIGTENGLSLFDGKKFKSFKLATNGNRLQIVSIQEIENGIFLTSVLNDLIKVHVDCKDIDKSYLEIISSRGCCTYSSIVWDGTYFSKNGDSSLALSHFTKSNDSLSSPYKSIYCPISWDFTSDLNNNLYCACWGVITPVGGLYRYKNGKVESISEQANIESKAIWCLYYDKNSNILWVGSLDKGLYKLYVNEETLFLKPDYFGLKDFAPKDVYNDRYNSTWIGAEGYIIKLKPDLTFKIIGKKELFDKIESYQKSLNQYNNSQTSFMHSKKAREGFIVYNFSEDTSNGIWIGTSWCRLP